MMFHLRHPLHGYKDTTNAVEAKQDRENGWEDYEPTPTTVKEETSLPSFLGGGESDIPASFPARQALIENGVLTWAELGQKSYDDLIALKGIGPATAKEILDKLNS